MTAEQEEPKGSVKPDTRQATNDQVPLVFISHDSRDAELAEAFSTLLKRVSAGALKSFRSSDRAGTEGIQYGDEWYGRLMDKLGEATDVVCLFTKRSLNRPWILFEAGVAKGKLKTPVQGIALGVSLSQVSTGPFYQFHNCQDDEEGLTGLVMQLLGRVPNTDPDQEGVALQVQAFKKSVDEILAKLGDESALPAGASESSETSAAKLFEEIKIMVRDMPSSLEERLSDGASPFLTRRTLRVDPLIFDEMMHFSKDPSIGLLVACSFLRDNQPWLYDMALDAYRSAQSDRRPAAGRALRQLRACLEWTMFSPIGDIMGMGRKERHMIVRRIEQLLTSAELQATPRGSESDEDRG